MRRALFNYHVLSASRFKVRWCRKPRSDFPPLLRKRILLPSFLPVFFFRFSPDRSSFLSSRCVFFFSFRLPLFLSLLAHHGVTSYRSLAACHLHQAAGASSSGRQPPPPPLPVHASVSTLARGAHTHAHTGAARLRSASGRHTDGYGCHAGSAVLHSLSFPPSLPHPVPLSPSPRSGTHST